MKRIISVAVISIVSLSAIILIIDNNTGENTPENQKFLNDILYDAAKLLMQLIVIVIAGNFMITSYNTLRQKKQESKDFRKAIHKLLVNAYLSTKKSRYVLRAKCKSSIIPYSAYEKELQKIIDTKIQLEIIIHEIDENKRKFKAKEDIELKHKLESMENYLRNLIEEYTKGESPKIDLSDKVNVKDLKHLSKFISSRKTVTDTKKEPAPNNLAEKSDFTIYYRDHFYGAIDVLKSKKDRELADVK